MKDRRIGGSFALLSFFSVIILNLVKENLLLSIFFIVGALTFSILGIITLTFESLQYIGDFIILTKREKILDISLILLGFILSIFVLFFGAYLTRASLEDILFLLFFLIIFFSAIIILVLYNTLSEKYNLSLDMMDKKLDSIKDDTELIKEYVSAIEDVLDKVEDVELFLKTKLASDFEKIKYAWEFYKVGRITRKELISHGIKTIGKNLVKKII